ncbi:hypothetical protein RRG08_013598 [Elysia crispata]|uniref:Uncharacterized protein n=1 Tax=Elysia crispata TaxID=231223 RepID=A0AAE1CRG7_9GAST|nr:hypothetical protein RRG08_013598 [Elysia crispata]
MVETATKLGIESGRMVETATKLGIESGRMGETATRVGVTPAQQLCEGHVTATRCGCHSKDQFSLPSKIKSAPRAAHAAPLVHACASDLHRVAFSAGENIPTSPHTSPSLNSPSTNTQYTQLPQTKNWRRCPVWPVQAPGLRTVLTTPGVALVVWPLTAAATGPF